MTRSTTHEHLLAVINTECRRFPAGVTIRILEAGCGAGSLMDWLGGELGRLRPEYQFDMHGFDVDDFGIPGKTSASDPRIRTVSIHDPWPYDSETFDVILSNQVLEHVALPDLFFREMRRTLRPGGFAVHQFPLKSYLLEGHLLLPFVHWIDNHDTMCAYIRLLSRLRLGRYPAHSAARELCVEEFSEQHADFMMFFTRYHSARELLQRAHRHGLRASWRYSQEYYKRRLAKLFGRPQKEVYNARRSAVKDLLWFMVIRHISGVTLFLEKQNTYRHGTEESVREILSANADAENQKQFAAAGR